MQGYILHTQKVKDEDLIVYILTDSQIIKSYRFYGARHASIMNGYKIDFELNKDSVFLPHLRSVLHLGFKWLLQREKLIIWQQFTRLIYFHLRDVDSIENFYFKEIELCANRLDKQNPKRLILESYIRILEYEGRLHSEFECFLCDEVILNEVCLVRGFLPTHINCINQNKFSLTKIKYLFDKKTAIMLDDNEVNSLYNIILEGI